MFPLMTTFGLFLGLASFLAFGWLLWLGEWRVLVFGLIIAIVGRYVLGLAVLLGGAVLGLPMTLGLRRGWLLLPLLLLFLFASQVYTHALVAAWCVVIYIYLLSLVHPEALVSAALWAYGVALGPWEIMAQADERASGDRHSGLLVGFAAAGYLTMALSDLWLNLPLGYGVVAFVAVMALSMPVQLVAVWPIFRAERDSHRPVISREFEPPWR